MSFGKLFASTFTGSMVGSGPDVFAVWAYVVSHARDSQVELNPILLGAMIGMEAQRVEKAIDVLCQPDPKSRNKAEEGRRLLKEGEFAYRVVSHSIYREMRNEDARREYNRIKKQESRARLKSNDVNDSQQCQPRSAQAESETEPEKEGENAAPSPVLTKMERQRQFIESLKGKTRDKNGCIMEDWLDHIKGLKEKDVEAIFKETSPGIRWPSQFRAARDARGW